MGEAGKRRRMHGLDVEEVKLAGKPRVEVIVSTSKTIRCRQPANKANSRMAP